MRFGVILFPGSNCALDTHYALYYVLGQSVRMVWHKERAEGIDVFVLPGGFSYGDYLRAGAIARFSPAMNSVIEHAEKGGLVLGICNGFQILTESGLLPGSLIRNRGLKFVCQQQFLRVENENTPFTRLFSRGEVVQFPIAHNEGNYVIEETALAKIRVNNQVIFRYCDQRGEIREQDSPNGATFAIAGVVNQKGNVLGMMPHPERACESVLGSADGVRFFRSIVLSLKRT